MSRYRKIDPRIWNDQKFSSFSERGKLLFFYVLTHPNMTMIGMLRATPEGLFSELGMSSADCLADWQALCNAGVVEYDKHGLVRLPNFLKYNEPESPSVVKAWSDCYDLLPECELLKIGREGIEKYLISRGNSWIQAYNHTAKQPNGQTASQSAMQTARHQEQEQEQEQKQDIKKKSKKEKANPVKKPESVTDELWNEFLSYRKHLGKKYELTQRALNGLLSEGQKAGWTPTQVFEKIMEKQWIGFEADWVTKGKKPSNSQPDIFTEDYYASSINPDGTPNWGI